MSLLLSLVAMSCSQEDVERLLQFKVGTKWIYSAHDKEHPEGLTAETTLTESHQSRILIETRHFENGNELGKKMVQSWCEKDGFLMLDMVPVYKLGGRKGDTWTYRILESELTATNDGIEDLRVPAGVFKEAIVVHHGGGGGDVRLWFAPGVGIIKSETWAGKKGPLLMELKEFIKPEAVVAADSSASPRAARVVPSGMTPSKAIRTLDPWDGKELETWYRFKIKKDDEESYRDTGLKAREGAGYILAHQAFAKNQVGPIEDQKVELGPVKVTGPSTIRVKERDFTCDIVERPAGEKNWIVKEGRFSGAILRSELPEGVLLANQVWENTLTIKGHEFECLVVEAELKSGDKTEKIKTWFTSTVPMRAIKVVREESSTALVDFGATWSKRPPFPGVADPRK